MEYTDETVTELKTLKNKLQEEIKQGKAKLVHCTSSPSKKSDSSSQSLTDMRRTIRAKENSISKLEEKIRSMKNSDSYQEHKELVEALKIYYCEDKRMDYEIEEVKDDYRSTKEKLTKTRNLNRAGRIKEIESETAKLRKKLALREKDLKRKRDTVSSVSEETVPARTPEQQAQVDKETKELKSKIRTIRAEIQKVNSEMEKMKSDHTEFLKTL